MSLSSLATLSVTVILALLGYLITHASNLRLARRKDRLDRVNRQLSDFYGPLYALTEASGRAWNELLAVIGDSSLGSIRFSEENIATWRLWVTHVFMPLNRQMMEIVVRHSDLIVDEGFPKCLEDLCAHVVCYEPTMERWKDSEFNSSKITDNLSVIDFPEPQLGSYIKSCYMSLKKEQERLLDQVQ